MGISIQKYSVYRMITFNNKKPKKQIKDKELNILIEMLDSSNVLDVDMALEMLSDSKVNYKLLKKCCKRWHEYNRCIVRIVM